MTMFQELVSNNFQYCFECVRCSEAWKYFKDEGGRVLNRVYRYCPVRHPNLAQPVVPSPGQEEITHEEFSRLKEEENWPVQ